MSVFLNIIVPCYNEQEVIEKTAEELNKIIKELIDDGKVSVHSRITFVDDGSKDCTYELLKKIQSNNPMRFSIIRLSRNKGHQNALIAGLFNSPGDALISIDADLQDDVTVIKSMVDSYIAGSHIVYGVRKDRNSDSYFKRITAESYYKFLNILGVDVVFNHADFRLLSRTAVEQLKGFRERNLFLRAIIPQLGFKSSIVEYSRLKRFAGESKYPLTKMLGLAINGATSFSIVPLRMAVFIGMAFALITLIISMWVIVQFLNGNVIQGWTSTMLVGFFFGSIQLIFLGIIGEYIGKIYLETKQRPAYIIEEILDDKTQGLRNIENSVHQEEKVY